jgi:hypothetical protein
MDKVQRRREMKIVSDVYSESGKASVNLGQAIIIAAVVSQLFTQQPIGWGDSSDRPCSRVDFYHYRPYFDSKGLSRKKV